MIKFFLAIMFFLINLSYASDIKDKFQEIEKTHHLKIGVYAHDTNNGRVIAYRESQRFPFQSTCKMMVAAAMLKMNLEQKKVVINKNDLIFWHPISGQYLHQSVSLQTLAEGAISYSDNPATNVIIKAVGGLEEINHFAYLTSNRTFRINHYESNLNSDPALDDDSSTPADMAKSIEKILFSDLLSNDKKNLLINWMRNNTTGYKRIRAGVPLGWAVADKTGSGSFGIANDIGIVWSPVCKPVTLSIFTIAQDKKAPPKDEIIAEVTRLIFTDLQSHAQCYRATQMS